MASNIFKNINFKQFQESINSLNSVIWVGALSFEERCKASIMKLSENRQQLSKGILIDYQTKVEPSRLAERRRNENWDQLQELGTGLFKLGIERRPLGAYLFDDFRVLLDDLLSDNSLEAILLDITCLTKIHALAAATVMALQNRGIPWFLSYSTPENYGFISYLNQSVPAWKDIIIAPLADTATFFYESSGRGIIIPGHESDRLIVAVGEIEPAGGLIVMSKTERRPDLLHLSLRRNQKILQQLTKMRASNWKKQSLFVSQSELLKEPINAEINLAREKNAPVILFPYGPKPIIISIAFQLASEYPESSWFVYPIPMSYDANYSYGIETIYWYSAH